MTHLMIKAVLTVSAMYASIAMAKMVVAPTAQISSKDAIVYFDKLQRTRPLKPAEAEISTLIRIGVESLTLENFQINFPYGSQGADKLPIEQKMEAATSMNVVAAISDRIDRNPRWEPTLRQDKLKLATQNAALLKKSVGAETNVWAWFTYQMGQKDEAKKILERAFELQYQIVMKLQSAGKRMQSPIFPAEVILRSLDPLTTKAEKTELQMKMRKMRTHISNLPNMEVMT